MLLLQAVEQYLGSINTWPACIITNLFAEIPSLPVVEYLTAFFAGNVNPTTLAYTLYKACNPEAANELVHQLFHTHVILCGTHLTPSDDTMYYLYV